MSKSIMLFTKTIFPDFAIFIKRKDCRKSVVGKSEFFVGKTKMHQDHLAVPEGARAARPDHICSARS